MVFSSIFCRAWWRLFYTNDYFLMMNKILPISNEPFNRNAMLNKFFLQNISSSSKALLFLPMIIGISGSAQNAKPYSLNDVKSLEFFLDSIFVKEMDKSKIA